MTTNNFMNVVNSFELVFGTLICERYVSEDMGDSVLRLRPQNPVYNKYHLAWCSEEHTLMLIVNTEKGSFIHTTYSEDGLLGSEIKTFVELRRGI